MPKDIDCVLCGSCVADMLVRPIPLNAPIGEGRLMLSEPIEMTTGGLVCNAGIAMAKLGMKIAAMSYVGRDEWAGMVRRRLESAGIDCDRLMVHPTGATSSTAVLIDPSGERSFAHCVGAPQLMDKSAFFDNMDLFARSRMMLFGYYSLMPNVEPDLPEVLAALHEVGCQTAIDAIGNGGDMELFAKILPHLDVYVPSLVEATGQTKQDDPRRMLEVYRQLGAKGVVGVKLGSKGALLSPAPGKFLEIACATPPGPVVDTTGAGDCFFAGLLTGLIRGLDVDQAGRLAAATGACCVTGYGATAGLRDYAETAHIAGL